VTEIEKLREAIGAWEGTGVLFTDHIKLFLAAARRDIARLEAEDAKKPKRVTIEEMIVWAEGWMKTENGRAILATLKAVEEFCDDWLPINQRTPSGLELGNRLYRAVKRDADGR
jgi:hypothetical protein